MQIRWDICNSATKFDKLTGTFVKCATKIDKLAETFVKFATTNDKLAETFVKFAAKAEKLAETFVKFAAKIDKLTRTFVKFAMEAEISGRLPPNRPKTNKATPIGTHALGVSVNVRNAKFGYWGASGSSKVLTPYHEPSHIHIYTYRLIYTC